MLNIITSHSPYIINFIDPKWIYVGLNKITSSKIMTMAHFLSGCKSLAKIAVIAFALIIISGRSL